MPYYRSFASLRFDTVAIATQERRATSIGYQGNVDFVWEALVRWLSDWVFDMLLFHRSIGPQVSATTGTGCQCGRLLSDDWVTEWFSLWYASILQERRATSIGYHGNLVSVWEALVWWLSDWVSAILLFHRSVEPQVSVTTGTWCLCGRLLWRSWRRAAACLLTLDPIRKTALLNLKIWSYLALGRSGLKRKRFFPFFD